MNQKQWYLLETDEDYNNAIDRYESIKKASKGTTEHAEKLLLVHLIGLFENNKWDLPKVDPIEIIKIRMEDKGLKPVDLAGVYGDKGTISKVLNYKQSLSLTMIRKFSDLLDIPVSELTKEYKLA